MFIFDQKTSLSTDVDFSTTLLSAKLTGSLLKDGSTITITNDANFILDTDSLIDQVDPKTISTIYEHEGELFLASKRLEKKYEG